jgi:hypothetical protein
LQAPLSHATSWRRLDNLLHKAAVLSNLILKTAQRLKIISKYMSSLIAVLLGLSSLFHFQIKNDAKASRGQYQSYGKVKPTKSVLI